MFVQSDLTQHFTLIWREKNVDQTCPLKRWVAWEDSVDHDQTSNMNSLIYGSTIYAVCFTQQFSLTWIEQSADRICRLNEDDLLKKDW